MARRLVDRIAERPLLFHYLRKLPEMNYRATKARIRHAFARVGPRRVLDLGCGTGEFAALFPPESYLGVDVHPGYVRLAGRLRPAHRFVCADAIDWPGERQPFDLTLVNGVFHHLDDDTARGLLSASVRHTRSGGTLLVIEDAHLPQAGLLSQLVHALDHGHFIRTPEAWSALVSEFVRVEESETYQSGLCPYHLMLGSRA